MLPFTQQAESLLARGSATPDELARLRVLWLALGPEERAGLTDMARRIAKLPAPTLDPFAAAYASEDSPEQLHLERVQQAAQARVAERFYDGPQTPEALLDWFGLPAFRPGQREAVAAALAGQDSLVVMPTGGGKSLCYQLPALASSDLTVVVSPLIALMADQYERLVSAGHAAVMFASGMDEDLLTDSYARVEDGVARVLFCSPERFASQRFMSLLEQRTVRMLVVDEAHCLSEWGHDFRPDYLRLPQVIERLGHPTVMACTATATPQVAQEIEARLGLRDALQVNSGFDRPNISFDVLSFGGDGAVERKMQALHAGLLMSDNRPAIVYCGTRKDTDKVCERLRVAGLRAVAYHAGLDATARAGGQRAFMSGEADVVVATNAFGMGVDKADVRSVWHWAIPTSVEAYYQEAGRAGRDGLPARAVLLAMRGDLGRLVGFNKNRSTSPEHILAFLRRLRQSARDGVVVIQAPDDADRLCLAIAERCEAVTVEPAGPGQLRVTLSGAFDRGRAQEACNVAVDRGWQAYRAIERYVSVQECRRQMLLDHFGDPAEGQPVGRCCDVHDPVTWLPEPDDLPAVPGGRTRTRSSRPATVVASAEGPLYDTLVAWRREASAGKPAYTVAQNATLAAIADQRPTDVEGLLALRGVGPSFIDKHGEAVLDIVRSAS